MDWFRKLWEQLSRIGTGTAQRNVDQIDRTLAELRAKVRTLPPEQQAAFAQEIQSVIAQQARAHNRLNNALDDRHSR